jgi:hypothetical protein
MIKMFGGGITMSYINKDEFVGRLKAECYPIEYGENCKDGGMSLLGLLQLVDACTVTNKTQDTEPWTRERVLEEAGNIISGNRDLQYGEPEESFTAIADLWNAYIDKTITLTAKDVAMMMVLFKVAREATGQSKPDNLIDIAGYAACAAECEK